MRVKDASEIRRVDDKPSGSTSTQAAAVVAPDKVSTGSSAQVVAASAAARSSLASDHGLRLEAIKEAVRSGTFKPDPQRIAQQILDDAELTAMLQTLLKRG